MNLPILGNSYKLKHFIIGLFHLAFFKVQSFCSMTQNIIPWEDWIIPSCTYIPHFVYPFIYWDIRVIFTFWLVWLMLPYTLVYNVSLSFYFQLFYTYTEKMGLLDHMVILFLTFWVTNSFSQACTILHSHHQCTTFPISPYCRKNLVFSI